MGNMKDSGIEWIGMIPEDWDIVRLKDYFSFEKGNAAALIIDLDAFFSLKSTSIVTQFL